METKMMKNILLKLSGEAFGKETKEGVKTVFDVATVNAYANAIKDGLAYRAHIYVVCGGGNVCRGRSFGDHVLADYAGMLASIQNALFLNIELDKYGVKTQVVTPDNFQIPHTVSEADIEADTRVIIYAGGVGEPGHSTDYICAVKAKEHNCDIYFAKHGCDGVYDRDPNGDDKENAVFFPQLTFEEIAEKNLKVIDKEAAELLVGAECCSYVFELTAQNIGMMLCANASQLHKTEIR
ncbi:MAG: hypothetical protein J6I50_02360 [Clostridia bacterium]|nr:hypothetical protein [Clostridia bacterium]